MQRDKFRKAKRMQTKINEGHRTIKLKEKRQHEKEKWRVQMKGHNHADVKTVTNNKECDRKKRQF